VLLRGHRQDCLCYLKNAGAEERVRACDGFGDIEGSSARRDAVRCERFVRGVRYGFRREGMRQRFESGVVIEREVNAFVGVDEDEDARCGGDGIRQLPFAL
jgi:hypothetical protein